MNASQSLTNELKLNKLVKYFILELLYMKEQVLFCQEKLYVYLLCLN